MTQDAHFLAHALRFAARGQGRTWPNPSVGCVLVRDGHVLAAARTGDGGRPHAETLALAAAGDARGAIAYVSLEPCAHHGATPPCAKTLIDAGVARVVIAAIDPDPRVAGRGIAMLEAGGITVLTLPQNEKIINPLRGFFRRVTHGFPEVGCKLATSLDGRIADAHGVSQWITGPAARTHGHALRATYDAIVTGIGTVLTDDAPLTVRLPGATAHPLRIVCDRRLRLPLTSKLVRSASANPVWIITGAEAVEHAASHATELREAGVVLHVVEDETLAPRTILTTLGAAGLTRVLIEAGPALTTAFLGANLVDTLHWYRAPILLGNTGAAVISALDTSVNHAPRAVPTERIPLGPDVYERYELTACLPD